MSPLKSISRNIPNAITCLNLVSGTLACVYALRGAAPTGGLRAYEVAAILIGCAAVFDFCDGLAARLLRAVSPMGKELDSLCDAVSFGVAPAMMVYALIDVAAPGSWLKYVALLVAVCGALRLARFNTDTTQAVSFLGLPIPANAIFWIGYCCWQYDNMQVLSGGGIYALAALVVAVSLLMVCRLRMFSLKFKNFSLSGNWHRYLIALLTVVCVAAQGVPGLASAIIAYVALSAVTHGRTKRMEA